MRYSSLLILLLLPACTGTNPEYLPNVRHVFVTAGTYGAPSVLDRRLCSSAAGAAGLTGTWVPWVSYASVDFESENAIDRVKDLRAWVDINDTLLFRNWESLKIGPENPILTTQFGSLLPMDSPIWTGTTSEGTRSDNICFDLLQFQVWASDQPTDRGGIGRAGRTDVGWTADGFLPCSEQAHVLCFEK